MALFSTEGLKESVTNAIYCSLFPVPANEAWF